MRHFERLKRLERLGHRPAPVQVRVVLNWRDEDGVVRQADGSPAPPPEPGGVVVKLHWPEAEHDDRP